MMIGSNDNNCVPELVDNSGDGVAAEAEGGGEFGGGLNIEEEKLGSNSGGNRWPRQETIALLKIRSEMDVVFRDSSLKGPLWEDVSRKLAELGYHRSAKKCKEKFENVYKYHKRTKDGRTTKPDGKTYRFFEQLEALDTHPPHSLSSPMKPHNTQAMNAGMLGNHTSNAHVTVSSTPSPITTVFPHNATPMVHPINLASQQQQQPLLQSSHVSVNPAMVASQGGGGVGLQSYNNANMCGSGLLSDSTSSTSSDEEPPERRRKRKRKWEDFFGRLMTEVIQKQDELQKKFLDTLEKRERDRMIREEAWRVQEMAKMNREHDLLVQERSIAAAKDAAVIAFLQKMTEQQNSKSPVSPPQLQQIQVQLKENSVRTVPAPAPAPAPAPVVQPQQATTQAPPQQPAPAPAPAPAPVQSPAPVSVKTMDLTIPASNGGGEIFLSPSPSRWPKAEVQALIKLRTTLDNKYHENGPKGPLWEEISASMRKLGYNRNAKRCKEKWENINKYYKKVKESNKKRPEDAKTCPYFHQLEALYKEKAKTDGAATNNNVAFNPMAPLMVQPEQQWPLQPQQHQGSAMEEHEGENLDQNNDDYDDGDNDDEEDDDDGAGYEIVTNKQPSAVQATAE